jgi:hypothetical protein
MNLSYSYGRKTKHKRKGKNIKMRRRRVSKNLENFFYVKLFLHPYFIVDFGS